MNNQEIERLAREYAEEIYESSDLPFKDDIICDETDNAMSVLRFILRDHCIVPKGKVRELHRELFDTIIDFDEAKDALEHILSEMPKKFIGTFGIDLFNERSEK